jgi:redox-sensitive bicupin YhaK (pirin superfamily)
LGSICIRDTPEVTPRPLRPFVMNTVVEIKQAMLDFQSGKFGAMTP